ncbi:uncharacterized protein DSM5745_10316 [Aspergillus mulundensis]|uniref:Uncharacterized protein n=1 Tax=Aspergillus mulundensis TaxID=1810919 RepID=A0A3D8QN32_9EURO|nr:Uncharacterized protein DSM5745_10316 [Aspergillus mulundensis]RDW63205.1 Uncharacterized protein DSM5745_10316 [Aspergillus mulundensis]
MGYPIPGNPSIVPGNCIVAHATAAETLYVFTNQTLNLDLMTMAVSEGLGVSRLPVSASSTAYHIRTSWVQGALSDPCLFHATLYAGSSYLDIQQGHRPSAITVHHRSEAIRHLNERLSNLDSALDDRTLIAITPLAMFAGLNGDRTAGDAHRDGLRKLVEMRGGLDKLGYNGLVAAVIQMSALRTVHQFLRLTLYRNTIIYHIAFDIDPTLTHAALGPPPTGVEMRILDPSKEASAIPSLPAILAMFQDVLNVKLAWQQQQTPESQQGHNNSLQEYTNTTSSPSLNDPILHCCHLSVTIFHLIMQSHDYDSLSKSSALNALASELQASLARTETELWVRHIPAILSWVCLTGAAASNDARTRIWLYFRQAAAVRVLNVRGRSSFVDELWAHFYWLRVMRLNIGNVQYVDRRIEDVC